MQGPRPNAKRSRPVFVAGDRLASGSARGAGAFVTLIAVATADLPLRLARLVSFLRPADIVHVLEASSSGALGVGAGFRTAHEITFGRWPGALCAGAFRTLLRHVFLRWGRAFSYALLALPRPPRRFHHFVSK